MSKHRIPPLTPMKVVLSRGHTSSSIAWSCDAELAVAADDSIHIFAPHFRNEPTIGDEDDLTSSSDEEDDPDASVNGGGSRGDAKAKPWFLRNSPTGRKQYSSVPLRILSPQITDPRLNRNLLARKASVIKFNEEEDDFAGAGVGSVTGFGSAINQVVAVEWSPSGLGANLRPVLAAMLTKGMVYVWGEEGPDGGEGSAAPMDVRTRDMRTWRLLWGIGANLPMPGKGKGGYKVTGDKIRAFSWAGEITVGKGLLAYHTDTDELVVMSVQYLEKVDDPGSNKHGRSAWKVDEVSRMKIPGPHIEVDVHDADYTPYGSAFSVKWSPWFLSSNGARTAALAYISRHYIGFRRVILSPFWESGKLPKLQISSNEILGICCHLSPDAFLVWEDRVWPLESGSKACRGVIVTPSTAKPFQVNLFNEVLPMPCHHTNDCKTTYSPTTGPDSFNPITGLVIKPPPASATLDTHPVPFYTLTRLTATSTNTNWLQHNYPDTSPSSPSTASPFWAMHIHQLIHTGRPERKAYLRIESDSSGSERAPSPDPPTDDDEMINESEAEDEDEAEDDREAKLLASAQVVFPHRARIWAITPSPGGGASAILFSKHSTTIPDRIIKTRVAFSPVGGRRGRVPDAERETPRWDELTAEGRAWEWMYGGGRAVPGFSSDIEPKLGSVFAGLVEQAKCPLCNGGLQLVGIEYSCTAGHMFSRCATSGLPVLEPGTTRTCALCAQPNMLVDELLRVAREHGISTKACKKASRDVCNACGGKFTA